MNSITFHMLSPSGAERGKWNYVWSMGWISEWCGPWKWLNLLIYWLSEGTRIAQRQCASVQWITGYSLRVQWFEKKLHLNDPWNETHFWQHNYSTKTILLVGCKWSPQSEYTATTSVVSGLSLNSFPMRITLRIIVNRSRILLLFPGGDRGMLM